MLQQRRIVEKRLASLKRLADDGDELELWRQLLDLGESATDFGPFLERVEADLEKLELELTLSGEDDGKPAILAIHPGAGGTESQDWAEMLLRMYLRWAEQGGFEVELLDRLDGDEAGIKSATLAVRGENAFGYLKGENGVHRLVRISPYDSAARRHTSFASVYVYPEIDDTIHIDINPVDLKTDTFRASGAGGQHVNKTESAIRITHMPTGTVVSCQMERSQHKNRATAMKMLRAKLYDLERQKREAEQAKIEGAKLDNSWGSQIRSYVLQPYRLVKDHRTGTSVGDASRVLDGYLEPFIQAWLKGAIAEDTDAELP